MKKLTERLYVETVQARVGDTGATEIWPGRGTFRRVRVNLYRTGANERAGIPALSVESLADIALLRNYLNEVLDTEKSDTGKRFERQGAESH